MLKGSCPVPPDWRDHVGHPAQLSRVDHLCHQDGAQKGTRVLRLQTPMLSLDVLPDRGFDIGHASHCGMPLSWIGPSGFRSAEHWSLNDTDWLRGFGGGLLATCGLDSFGPPSTHDGKDYGLHGLYGSQCAQIEESRVAPDGRLRVSATVRQGALFGEHLVMRRTITLACDRAELTIEDGVTNEAAESQGHMLLYHFNFGWPLVSAGSRIEGPSGTPIPRDEPAAAKLDQWDKIHAPDDDPAERVYIHEAQGHGHARLINPSIGLAAHLQWDATHLPAMFQWVMLRKRTNAVGLEPANTKAIMGRAQAQQTGELPILEPGESRHYSLRLSIEAAA